MTEHQKKQQEVINAIEEQIKDNTVTFTTVAPVENFEDDPRLCLSGFHIPNDSLKEAVQHTIINPLKAIAPEHYYYTNDSLHITVKSIRAITERFSRDKNTSTKAKEVFSTVVPKYTAFTVFFYRLLLFPTSLALVGTTDPEFDDLVLELENELRNAGIPDDRKYANNKYFFCNMTFMRFSKPVSTILREKIEHLSQSITVKPYTVDSVSLVSCNAVFKKRNMYGTWLLK